MKEEKERDSKIGRQDKEEIKKEKCKEGRETDWKT
jgi:hypothetical protein